MTRVTLVVNRHHAPSETFQRSLASILAGGGHAVTVHALETGRGTDAAVEGVGRSEGLAPLSARPTPKLVGQLIRSSDRAMAVAVRRGRARFGTGSRALRAALVAGPILASRPEVVHLGFSGIGVGIRDALDLLDGVTVVVSCRGTDELIHPLLDTERADALAELLGAVDRVHVVADAVGDAVLALGADPSRIRVIRPAVDLEVWTPRPPPAELHGRPVHLVAVSRLAAAKAHGDLLTALAIVRAGAIDARLTIVGEGPERDVLRLRAARAGLGDAVTLVGAQKLSKVMALISDADLFVSASLSEGISNGVLEAMARQVPVVATAVGGMAEAIADGDSGWLVPPSRPDLLAAAVLSARADPARLGAVAAAGRARAVEAFGLDRQRAEWLAFYDELPVRSADLACRNVPPREGTH